MRFSTATARAQRPGRTYEVAEAGNGYVTLTLEPDSASPSTITVPASMAEDLAEDLANVTLAVKRRSEDQIGLWS